jgi:hypothetical protein
MKISGRRKSTKTMAKSGGMKIGAMKKGGMALPGTGIGKGKKKWCGGDIWFTEDGCLYINDPSLAEAVQRNFLETGKLCVTIPDEFSPSYELNILCKC